MSDEYRRRELDMVFQGSGEGTPEDPMVPVVLVEGVVDGDIVVDFTATNTKLDTLATKLDQLKALIGTASDDESDVTVIGLLTRIALAVEA
jgi:hypothetical protein